MIVDNHVNKSSVVEKLENSKLQNINCMNQRTITQNIIKIKDEFVTRLLVPTL